MFGFFCKNSYTFFVEKNNSIKLNYFDFLIFEFFNFNSFCDFFYLLFFYLSKNNLKYLFKYFKLYEYNNSYFFIINNFNFFNNYFLWIFLNILEFSDNYYFSELLLRRITEYGNLIFNNKNINEFNKYFLRSER